MTTEIKQTMLNACNITDNDNSGKHKAMAMVGVELMASAYLSQRTFLYTPLCGGREEQQGMHAYPMRATAKASPIWIWPIQSGWGRIGAIVRGEKVALCWFEQTLRNAVYSCY